VLEVKALQTLKQLAVSVLEAVSFVNDHHPPLDVLKFTLVSCLGGLIETAIVRV
jgi:hypothetical protein